MPQPRQPAVQTFEARGKLMLTGEYLVLDGANALAVPTRPGQRLRVTVTDEDDVLLWRSFDHRAVVWFEEAYSRRRLQRPADRQDSSPAARLSRLLHAVLEVHPLLWPPGTGLSLEARLDFPRDWGLGSSATLAYLLAAWAGTDAYALNEAEFGGSGYDIACAGATGPLLYRRKDASGGGPVVVPLDWRGAWLQEAYLVHLGQKQDSRVAIADYRARAGGELTRFVREVDTLTQNLLDVTDSAAAAEVLRRHEALIGYVTHQTPVGRARFSDFPGVVKSLGAWGGNFVLALPTENIDVVDFFGQHGLTTVLPAPEILMFQAPAALAVALTDASRWPVFLYGELAAPDAERDWLAGYPWTYAELADYALAPVPPYAPVALAGGRISGLLVYLPPHDLIAMDLHPAGRGFRRSHALVEVAGRQIQAQVWLGQ